VDDQARRGIGMDADAFSPVHGDGMDAGGRATQERLPNALAKSPAAAHGLAGQNARQVPRRVAFSLVTFSYSGHPALRPSDRLRRSRPFQTGAWRPKRK